jgi:hypothetical protein
MAKHAKEYAWQNIPRCEPGTVSRCLFVGGSFLVLPAMGPNQIYSVWSGSTVDCFFPLPSKEQAPSIWTSDMHLQIHKVFGNPSIWQLYANLTPLCMLHPVMEKADQWHCLTEFHCLLRKADLRLVMWYEQLQVTLSKFVLENYQEMNVMQSGVAVFKICFLI